MDNSDKAQANLPAHIHGPEKHQKTKKKGEKFRIFSSLQNLRVTTLHSYVGYQCVRSNYVWRCCLLLSGWPPGWTDAAGSRVRGVSSRALQRCAIWADRCCLTVSCCPSRRVRRLTASLRYVWLRRVYRNNNEYEDESLIIHTIVCFSIIYCFSVCRVK